MRYKGNYYFKMALVVIILGLFFACGEGTRGGTAKESGKKVTWKDYMEAGKGRLMLPDFSLQDLEGKEHRLVDYVGKKPVLLVFWTTSCPYCIKEIPDLNNIFVNRADDLELLSINITEPERMVKRLVKSRGVKYPVLLDLQGKTARSYQVRGVTTIIVIDMKGGMGYYGHSLPEAMKKIEGLPS